MIKNKMDVYTVYTVVLLSVNFHLAVCQRLYECPLPWVEYWDSCYKFEVEPASLDQAWQNCNNIGANLFSVNSRAEHDFLVKWLTSHSPTSLQWYTRGSSYYNQGEVELMSLTYTWHRSTETRERPSPTERARRLWVVYTLGDVTWVWNRTADSDTQRPYVCEVLKNETFRINDQYRDFDYGRTALGEKALLRGPKIIEAPEDQVYDASSFDGLVSFTCRATGHPRPRYKWFRITPPGDVMQPLPPSDAHYSFTGGKLSIHDPERDTDEGSYACVASNSVGFVLSAPATLNFGYILDFPHSPRDPVVVDAYKGVSIDCNPPRYGGYKDRLRITWWKDKFTNIITTNTSHVFMSRGARIYFSAATMDDGGMYTCMVSPPGSGENIHSFKQSMPIRLIVREAAISSTFEMVRGFPKAFPSSPRRGQDVYLECVAWGRPPHTYRWRRNGVDVPSSELLDLGRVLLLRRVQLDQAGDYTCSVRNHLGSTVSGTTVLHITASPYFNTSLPDQHSDRGATVRWRCNGQGVPLVTNSWFRNAKQLVISELDPSDQTRYSISDGSLTIDDVTEADQGMYQCRARNPLGEAFTSAQLRILEFAPNFDRFPLPPVTYAVQKTSVGLRCDAESAPVSTKTWSKDGQTISPGTDERSRVSVLRNGNLFFQQVLRYDAGVYACTASNDQGQAETTGNLTVIDAAVDRTYGDRRLALIGSVVLLPCGRDKRHNPSHADTLNSSVDVAFEWQHGGKPIEFKRRLLGPGNIPHYEYDTHYAMVNGSDLAIRDVQEQHSGEYKCRMKTPVNNEVAFVTELAIMGPPGPPYGLIVNAIDADSAELSWYPGEENGYRITQYLVEGLNLLMKEQVWRDMNDTGPLGGEWNTMVTMRVNNLRSGTPYRFRVRAVNKFGKGAASDETFNLLTDATAPTTYPENVRGGGGKEGTLVMEWDPLPREDHNGRNLRYVVFWRSYNGSEPWNQVETNSPRHVVVVGAQNYYLPYEVKVRAVNDQGQGPVSNITVVHSAERKPRAISRDIWAVANDSSTADVAFIPVIDTRREMGGKLKGYKISYWLLDTESESDARYIIIHGQSGGVRIGSLEPARSYGFLVQVFNSEWFGWKSIITGLRLPRLAPRRSPHGLAVRVIDESHVEVTWDHLQISEDEDPLVGYTIRLWSRVNATSLVEDFDPGNQTSHILTDLKPGVVYEVRVFGYSNGGEGPLSVPVVQFILGDCRIIEDSSNNAYSYECDDPGRPSRAVIHLNCGKLMLFITLTHFMKLYATYR